MLSEITQWNEAVTVTKWRMCSENIFHGEKIFHVP